MRLLSYPLVIPLQTQMSRERAEKQSLGVTWRLMGKNTSRLPLFWIAGALSGPLQAALDSSAVAKGAVHRERQARHTFSVSVRNKEPHICETRLP